MGGYGNSGAKVSKMDTVAGYGLWHIFDRGGQPYVTVCDGVVEGVKCGPKKWHILWMDTYEFVSKLFRKWVKFKIKNQVSFWDKVYNANFRGFGWPTKNRQ